VSEFGAPSRLREALLAFLACWLIFAAYSFLRVPVPGINEPHYLGMAKADWDPAWCRGDLFLSSARPHRAFYLLIGWLTQVLSLEQTAIVGRIVSLAMVAWGWSKLSRALGLSVVGAILSSTTFLAIQSAGSWSGEWLIGGVESKVFSYGFVFAGWAALIEGRTSAAGTWLGLATTMHPIVGMWATVATLCALAWKWWQGAGEAARTQAPLPRVPLRLAPSLWWFATAAPGIGWAIPTLRSADAATSKLADFIQVSYRLAHHLDPWTFPRSGHLFFGALIVIWLIARWKRRGDSAFQFVDQVTTAAILFGVAATVLSYGSRPWVYPPTWLGSLQLKMLKFYPFRLADLMSAAVVAWSGASLWGAWVRDARLSLAISAALVTVAVLIPGPDQAPGGFSGATRDDWIATLRWVDENSPANALLLSANDDYGVKWWAQRPEYVNFKDCPQDARGVVEWNSRLLTYSNWFEAARAGDPVITAEELRELRHRTGVTHLIVGPYTKIEARPAFERGQFKVFELPHSKAEVH